MHISEGVLSAPVLITGIALTAVGTGIGLKKIDYQRLPHAGILAASFFVASLIHIPIGPVNVHLILNGIIGLILGWAVFPTILVALVLQALFFQFGGITTLGINTCIMAIPAILCYFIFRPMIVKEKLLAWAAAFACGFLSVLLGAVLVSVSLILTESRFDKVSLLVIVSHIPLMILEGFITSVCYVFLKKVKPSMLHKSH